MEKEPKIENFEAVDLKAVKPMDKNFMISFDAKSKAQNDAYNAAILLVCKEHGLSLFHQVGFQNETGYQAWEIWTDIDQEALEGLFSEIHKKAEEFYNPN